MMGQRYRPNVTTSTETGKVINPSGKGQPMNTFYNAEFLRTHCREILDFYQPNVIDPSGGFVQNFLDDGSVFDPGFRQLVSSTRMIVNYALASRLFPGQGYDDMAHHGLRYLEEVHWQPTTRTSPGRFRTTPHRT